MSKYVDYFESDEIRKRELLENLRWYQGAEDRLEYFFKQEYQTFKQSNGNPYDIIQNQVKFWRSVGGDVPRVHSGLPKLITNTMVNLITGNGFECVVSRGEEKDEVNTQRLKMMLDDIGFNDVWIGGTIDSSWAGYTMYKIVHDKDISKYPFIEKVTPSMEELRLKRGKVTGATFKSFRKQDDANVEIHEIFDLVDGKLVVEYKAFKIKDGKLVDLPLPQDIAELETKYPFDFLPFQLHNNTVVNSRFPDSPYGESDYTAVQSLFHMLDDLISQSELEVANAQAVKFVSDSILKKDTNGNPIGYDKNETVVILSPKDMDTFDVNKFVALIQPNIRVEQYEKTIKELTARILTIAGISPLSAGLPGFESVQASAQSQREREKSSLRTRAKRLDGIKITLEDLFIKLLKYDDWLNKRTIQDYNVHVNFSEYATPTLDDRIDTIGKAVATYHIMDVATGVDELFSEKTDEEKAMIILAIKLENGIPLLRDDYERAGLNPPQPQAQQVEVE